MSADEPEHIRGSTGGRTTLSVVSTLLGTAVGACDGRNERAARRRARQVGDTATVRAAKAVDGPECAHLDGRRRREVDEQGVGATVRVGHT
jgi:hypothetical protein